MLGKGTEEDGGETTPLLRKISNAAPTHIEIPHRLLGIPRWQTEMMIDDKDDQQQLQ